MPRESESSEPRESESSEFDEFLDRMDVSVADYHSIEELRGRLLQVLEGGEATPARMQAAQQTLQDEVMQLEQAGLRTSRRTFQRGTETGFFTAISEIATGRVVAIGDWPYMRDRLNERYGLDLRPGPKFPEDKFKRHE